MKWREDTLHSISELYNKQKYSEWNDAIKEGEIRNFSEELDGMLNRLASILVSEFELIDNPVADDKMKRILELAAVAGRTL